MIKKRPNVLLGSKGTSGHGLERMIHERNSIGTLLASNRSMCFIGTSLKMLLSCSAFDRKNREAENKPKYIKVNFGAENWMTQRKRGFMA